MPISKESGERRLKQAYPPSAAVITSQDIPTVSLLLRLERLLLRQSQRIDQPPAQILRRLGINFAVVCLADAGLELSASAKHEVSSRLVGPLDEVVVDTVASESE